MWDERVAPIFTRILVEALLECGAAVLESGQVAGCSVQHGQQHRAKLDLKIKKGHFSQVFTSSALLN